MKVWLSASELAELKLPELPASRENIQRLANRAGWNDGALSRPRAGLGGGREYHIDALPPQARLAYIARHIGGVVADVPEALRVEAAQDPAAEALTSTAARARDARLAILALAETFLTEAALSRSLAEAMFCDLYSSGSITVAGWVREEVKALCPRTLTRWRMARRAGQTAALGVDRGASRRGQGVLETANDGAVKTYMLGLIVHQPHLNADHLRRLVCERFGETLEVMRAGGEIRTVPVPPIRTLQHALKAWKTTYKVEITALTNPDAFKSRYRVSGRNSYRHITAANQLWMIDASPADVLLVEGRHTIYVAIDVATRRLMIYVSRTPRAEAVGLLMRRALLAWGVPQAVKTDNGSDFVAQATQRLFAHLGIEALTSAPFTPEEKAFVERAIGSVQRGLMPLLPGFIGHSVADRRRIEERRAFSARLGEDAREVYNISLTAADLQRQCDDWVEQVYARRPHDGLKGQTPWAVAASSREAIRTVDERALDMLLAPIASGGTRIVTKSGVRIDGHHYLAPYIMPETQVLVRMDPVDLGRAWLFAADGETYLGEAVCPALRGIDPKAAVAAAKAEQKRIIDARISAAKSEARRIAKGPALADLVLRQAARDAGRLIEFPKRTEMHETPALAAALDAALPHPVADRRMGDDELQAHAALVAEFEARQASRQQPAPVQNIQSFPEQPKHRFRRAVEIERALDAGHPVEPSEALWLGRYQTSAEYLAHRDDLYPRFGDAWLFA